MHRLTLIAVVFLSAVIVMHQRGAPDPFAEYEQARVRAHLDSAERELRAAPVAALTLSQRAARGRALDRLHEYWMRGVFPRNTKFPGQVVPYFIDHDRTRCAMAYLIEQSGARTFVAHVAATRNNARIHDLKSDPQLIAWLDENGLTPEEAARIQPAYDGCLECVDCCVFQHRGDAGTGYKVATVFSVGADVVSVALDARETNLSPGLTGALGVAAGVVGVMIGMPKFDESGERRTLGFLNAGAGAVSLAFGLHRLTAKRATHTPVSFAPWFSSTGVSGFSGRITF